MAPLALPGNQLSPKTFSLNLKYIALNYPFCKLSFFSQYKEIKSVRRRQLDKDLSGLIQTN